MLGVFGLAAEARLGVGLLPGLAQIAAAFNLGPEPHAVAGRQQLARSAVAVNQVEYIVAGAEDPRQFPVSPGSVSGEDESALAGAH